jgi:hypothetical protein
MLYNSAAQPLKSVPNAIPLLVKPVVRRSFGSVMQADCVRAVLTRAPQLTNLMALWVVLLLFIASVNFNLPQEYYPVFYGHLQAMADIADEVGDVPFFGNEGIVK